MVQPVETETGMGSGARCLRALLKEPLAPGATTKLQCTASFMRVQTPVPEAVFQNEPQRMVYEDNAYILFPYRVLKQTTRVGAFTELPMSCDLCMRLCHRTWLLCLFRPSNVFPANKFSIRLRTYH